MKLQKTKEKNEKDLQQLEKKRQIYLPRIYSLSNSRAKMKTKGKWEYVFNVLIENKNYHRILFLAKYPSSM